MIELQSFSLSKLQNCTNILYFGVLSKYFCTPRFHVYPDRIELLPDLDLGTSVHGCEKHSLPVPFETSSSWNQSALDDGVQVASVPDVVDALGEVVR